MADHGGLGGQRAAQEAPRNGAATREKRYADYGLEDGCANRNENVTCFEHPEKDREMMPREGAKYITHSDTF